MRRFIFSSFCIAAGEDCGSDEVVYVFPVTFLAMITTNIFDESNVNWTRQKKRIQMKTKSALGRRKKKREFFIFLIKGVVRRWRHYILKPKFSLNIRTVFNKCVIFPPFRINRAVMPQKKHEKVNAKKSFLQLFFRVFFFFFFTHVCDSLTLDSSERGEGEKWVNVARGSKKRIDFYKNRRWRFEFYGNFINF